MSQELSKTSSFFSANVVFINELYQKFLQNPNSVDASWAEFFKTNADELKSILSDYQGPSWAKRSLKVVGSQEFDISSNAPKEVKKDAKAAPIAASGKDLNIRLENLLSAYKRFGHLAADLDPIGLTQAQYVAEIDPKNHGITPEDLEKEVEFQGNKTKISQAIEYLNYVYINKIGAEFEYIRDAEQKSWLASTTENTVFADISKDEKIKILKEIIRTEKFEQFLHKRFPGAKRFSVEGGESSINSVEKIIETAAKSGVKKIVIGMAHRGRLNTLTGVMGKPYHKMISEFKGVPGFPEGVTKSGDVKYHMGYASSREIAGNKIDLSLAFNPSHLEAVNVVAAGRIRAKQALYGDASGEKAMALLIHGDAAFAGQGSVAESLVMNGVTGYNTGGVMHIIVNNQIGFTANPNDSRSTTYASDLAKMIDAPIFHVNGDDVEAVVKVSDIAMRYRQAFKKDVVIDVICYRKYGHNEGDEPLYTQPVMYTKLKSHPTLTQIYSQKLIAENVVSQADFDKMVADFESHLSAEFDKAENFKPKEADWLKGDWKNIKDGDVSIAKTAVDKKSLKNLAEKITHVPANFNVNPKIAKQLEARKNVIESEKDIDWGSGEALAFASLLSEGYPVRITGQDSGRGTFSHRHSILHDGNSGARHSIFSSLENKAKYEVYDSVLSEYGVLGFEYGYSLSMPNGLTIWEAQFGDFANGAQIIFDQFIASSEVKWLRKSGLVMLLPHGYEGQGPEHSSARLERYLQACADDNLRVVNITNPANFFHALRRQIHSKDRKPLVVMSPKSLLRHKLATSTLAEFSDLTFRPLISETNKIAADDKVRKVILCTGKVYYDLFEAREAKKINDVALVRLEQLYPFPKEELKAELKKYKNAEIIWCQEEPKNMGAWKFVDDLIEEALLESKHKNSRAKYVGRIACASPATGYGSYHSREQKNLIDEALK
ncbi:MAG: 2-oxoglutarate dehydrogenase E1 component [Rickettsiales bacterium]|nr:2-oxoglutarate dehydrogenase E1 component [Rickettsiales bacterium]